MSFGRWAHGYSDSDLARLAGQHLGLALAGRRVALLGAAAGALDGRVLALALPPLAAQLLAALEALNQPRVQYVLLRFPGVVLRLPPFPFHVVLHFVLERENSAVNVVKMKRVRRWRDVARLTGARNRRVVHNLADRAR